MPAADARATARPAARIRALVRSAIGRRSVRSALTALLAVVAAAVYWHAAFTRPAATGFGDWRYFHHMWEAGWVAVHRFGEWPLWDPYQCGGLTLWGNPQAQVYSPLFGLALLIGTTLALKLNVVAHAAVGLAGMYLLARHRYRLGRAAAATAAVLWAGSGFFAWHLGGGHSTFVAFYLAPCLLLAWRRAQRDLRWTVAVSLLLLLVLLDGGTYPFPYLLLLLVVDAAADLKSLARTRQLLAAALLTTVQTALLGAVRLLPIATTLRDHGRPTVLDDALSPGDLIAMLVARDYRWLDAGRAFVWPEYGTYLGAGAVLLAAGGVALAVRRRRWHLIVGAILFGALAMGSVAPFFPWPLLHRLPVFDSLRVPSRFAVLWTIYLALLAALAVDALARWLRRGQSRPRARWYSRVGAWCLWLGLVLDLLAVNLPITDRWRNAPVAAGPLAQDFQQVADADHRAMMASYPRLNVGTIGCYDPLNVQPASGLWLGESPQVRIAVGAGQILNAQRTPGTVQAAVALTTPGHLVVNQNYDSGWVSNVGVVTVSRGLLAIDLPAGEHQLDLRYRPWTLTLALWLLFGGLLVSGLIWLERPAAGWRWLKTRLGNRPERRCERRFQRGTR